MARALCLTMLTVGLALLLLPLAVPQARLLRGLLLPVAGAYLLIVAFLLGAYHACRWPPPLHPHERCVPPERRGVPLWYWYKSCGPASLCADQHLHCRPAAGRVASAGGGAVCLPPASAPGSRS